MTNAATHVAVIDIGKTNAKLALVDRTTLDEIAVVTRPNTVRPGPAWPHFDTEGHWDFLLDALGRFHASHGVDAIAITTHGASIVLLDETGALAAPVLDYEHPGPDDLAHIYNALRPTFFETGAPRLGGGLNVGAQLHWMFETDPDLRDRTAHILTYPQYWAYRLCGVMATERTSLGCHTDLWNPEAATFSSLVDTLDIGDKLAPPRLASDVLGAITREIATRTGLPADTPVYCGIHDSNASLLPHLIHRGGPFSVVSSGTWVIVMTVDGTAPPLDPARDTLINVNAHGNPVPSARFMGGREFEMIIAGQFAAPTDADIAEVLENDILLLPAIVPDTGPFQGHKSLWRPAEPPLGSGVRMVAASYYLALCTATCLELTGHRGPVIVEGPFARNTQFGQMLAAASNGPVLMSGGATGTSQGSALLVPGPDMTQTGEVLCEPGENLTRLRRYAERWRSHVTAMAPVT